MRGAVETLDLLAQLEVVWAWVQSPSGRDDLAAWKRVLTHLGFRDPRRSLAAAEVHRLRQAYDVG